MAIFMTSDVRGDFGGFSTRAFLERKDLGKDDYVIICGDFDGIWDGGEAERRVLDRLARPFITLFVDENCESMVIEKRLGVDHPTEMKKTAGMTVCHSRCFLHFMAKTEVE